MLVLDTDHLSVLEWEASATTQRLLERLSFVAPDEAATTIINFEEQMRGWLAYLSRTDADAPNRSIPASEKTPGQLSYDCGAGI